MIAPELIPCAAYCRCSTDMQEESIPAQKTEIERYAAKNGLQIVVWFVDDGISGGEDLKRPAFMRLISECESSKEFEQVVLWDLSRFTRQGPKKGFVYLDRILTAGKKIVSVRQGEIDLDEMGSGMRSFIEMWCDWKYRKDLSDNISRGKQRARAAGRYSGGLVLYGYKMGRTEPDSRGRIKLDSKPVPNEFSPIVREIFDRYSQGESATSIARSLNAREVPSPGKLSGHGKRGGWAARQILSTLERREYTGRYKIGEVTVECEAIVSESTFERVSRRLTGRRKVSSKRKGSYPLSGLTFCAHCGAPMCGAVSGPKRIRYMRCSRTYQLPGHCGQPLVREDSLLAGLIARLMESVLSEDARLKLRAAIAEKIIRGQSNSTSDTSGLQQRIADLDAKLAAASKRLLVLPESVLAQAIAQVEQLQAERASAAAELAAVVPPAVPIDLEAEVDRVMAHIAGLRERLATQEAAALGETLRELIQRVDVESTVEVRGKHRRATSRRARITLVAPCSASKCRPSGDLKTSTGGRVSPSLYEAAYWRIVPWRMRVRGWTDGSAIS